MDKKTPYRIVASGKKAERRDYSKVSGNLELPNLVEIQADSFEWFKNDGIAEVFNEIYPIQNYGGNIRLKFLGYEFEEPKYNAEDSMYRECNYAAPLKAKMELEITDTEPGFKGDTATGASKPATVETGAQVSVPLFVNQGDRIKIDTRTGEYLSRA